MTLVFMDGFDKYGITGDFSNSNIPTALTSEWQGLSGGLGGGISAPLSTTGYSLKFAPVGANSAYNRYIGKYLPANYGRLIGGLRFRPSNATIAVCFDDTFATIQSAVSVDSSGTISLRSGATGGPNYTLGTAIKTSTATVSQNTTHYLEWDITFGSSGAYQVWLDGVSIFSGAGNTITSANSYANMLYIVVQATSSGGYAYIDDLYLFDNTGTTNNTALQTNPSIETQFPVSTMSTGFSINSATINWQPVTGNSNNVPSNYTALVKITPSVNCTITSVNSIPVTTSSTANFKSVIYTDSSGPSAFLGSGPQVTGSTSGTSLVLPLTAPQSLTAGVSYWIGFITDSSLSYSTSGATGSMVTVSTTYSSGPPSTISSFSTTSSFIVIWGTLSLVSSNFAVINQNPPAGDINTLTGNISATTDTYGFPAMVSNSNMIYGMAMKTYSRVYNSGNRTANLQVISTGVTSIGNNNNAAILDAYSYVSSYFNTDPNTGSTFTQAAVNNATGGIRISS